MGGAFTLFTELNKYARPVRPEKRVGIDFSNKNGEEDKGS